MPACLPLGNDVVDLRHAQNLASAANPRFAERVLGQQEREALRAASGDPLVLWAFWAAKEAAYKSLRKLDPELVFAHRRFVVTADTPLETSGDSGSASGSVVHAGSRVPVAWTWDRDQVHCVSITSREAPVFRVDTLSRLRATPAFTQMRGASKLPVASVAARVLAMALLAERGLGDTSIDRPPDGRRHGPPQVIRHSQVLPGVDVSLSHDGRYAAAAVRIAAGTAGVWR